MPGSPEADGVFFKGGVSREVGKTREKGEEAKGAISWKSHGGHLHPDPSGALELELPLRFVPTKEQTVWPSRSQYFRHWPRTNLGEHKFSSLSSYGWAEEAPGGQGQASEKKSQVLTVRSSGTLMGGPAQSTNIVSSTGTFLFHQQKLRNLIMWPGSMKGGLVCSYLDQRW